MSAERVSGAWTRGRLFLGKPTYGHIGGVPHYPSGFLATITQGAFVVHVETGGALDSLKYLLYVITNTTSSR